MRDRLWMFIALGVLAVIAVAGWARSTRAEYPATSALYTPAADNAANPSAAPCVETAAYAQPAPPAYADRHYVRVVRRPEQQAAATATHRQESRRGRSTGKSVAIVAGSAGVGAAIGGLAGGGKGAAIGAISGGAAGFVYDRLTHKGR